MSSISSLDSLAGRSNRTCHKTVSLDKVDGLNRKSKSSGNISVPPQGVRMFITAIVSFSSQRKIKSVGSVDKVFHGINTAKVKNAQKYIHLNLE